MQIIQADFRSVQVRKEGLTLFIRYSLYQDGEERFPESIACREDTVIAYFLTSTIRDFLRETEWGFAVQRSWKIIPEGQFALSFYVDVPEAMSPLLLFPAEAAGDPTTSEGMEALGTFTAYPSALYLLSSPHSALVCADPPRGPWEPGSVGARRTLVEEESFLRVEVRVPARQAQPEGKVRRRSRLLAGYFSSSGDYERDLRLNVVVAPSGRIFQRGLRAVLERCSAELHPPPNLAPGEVRRRLEEAVRGCLRDHLVQRGGVCGLRRDPRSASLSAVAGVGLAAAILEGLPEDEELVETALRLADFSLKGQHPAGLFYDTYHVEKDSWLLQGAGPDNPPLIQLEESARIAAGLLRLAVRLRSLGLPSGRYHQAAERLAWGLLASRQELAEAGGLHHPDSVLAAAPGENGVFLLELFLQLRRLTGSDDFSKAAGTLARRFAAAANGATPAGQADPGTRPPFPSLEESMLQARGVLALAAAGYRPTGVGSHLNRLLSWVYLNPAASVAGCSAVGGAALRLGSRRLAFRGLELSLLVLRLQRLIADPPSAALLHELVPQLLAFTLQKPIGTAWLSLESSGPEVFGPVDSTVVAAELESLVQLQRELPPGFFS